MAPEVAGRDRTAYRSLIPPVTEMQRTLRASVRVAGHGIHTGAPARVAIDPAPPGAGLSFACGAERIPVRAAFVVGTRRCTSLRRGTARVDTVEHLLSALHALRIDNAEITIDGPEVPALDGSALPWLVALLDAGIEVQPGAARRLQLARPLALQRGDAWIVATPAPSLSVTAVISYEHPLVGTQAASFDDDPATYATDLAPARTFVFIEEVEALRASNLALGGSLDNALVVYPDRYSDRLRVPDECLRHKVVDLLGDLSLAGARIEAAITAIKPGHGVNAAFAALLAEQAREPV